MNKVIRIIGLIWYRPEHYDAILRIMADGDHFPGRYDVWRDEAELGEQKLRRDGHITVRVYIDPETFPDWCRARGLEINAQGRVEYANFIAYEHARNSH